MLTVLCKVYLTICAEYNEIVNYLYYYSFFKNRFLISSTHTPTFISDEKDILMDVEHSAATA